MVRAALLGRQTDAARCDSKGSTVPTLQCRIHQPHHQHTLQRMNDHRADTKEAITGHINNLQDKPVAANAASHNKDFHSCYSTRVVRAVPPASNSLELRYWELAHQFARPGELSKPDRLGVRGQQGAAAGAVQLFGKQGGMKKEAMDTPQHIYETRTRPVPPRLFRDCIQAVSRLLQNASRGPHDIATRSEGSPIAQGMSRVTAPANHSGKPERDKEERDDARMPHWLLGNHFPSHQACRGGRRPDSHRNAIWGALNNEVLRAMRVKLGENGAAPQMKGWGETGNPQENLHTSGIVWDERFPLAKIQSDPAGD
ncbi:hypothetical protein PR048_016153 [Dryococelus australis]|uniref:Uncharacterized protein n=1 Tax=Dryococelus australis TaxID=614101 RepID=A0ABQ9HIX8_9NEOP|nr:hypothetical protein PR048_016153 [Dryococelus australis]